MPQSEVVLHSNAFENKKIWGIRQRTFKIIVGEYGPLAVKTFDRLKWPCDHC